MYDVVVLGGGIAGISAAYHAQKRGFKAVIYESSASVGGLIANFEVDGFRFDNAIHLSFTKDAYVRSIFDKTSYLSHRPDAYSFDSGLWLKHPVQNNLYPLATDDKVDLIKSFLDRPQLTPSNYNDWLLTQYGEGIANRYPIPYTHKYWGLAPEKLSLGWIGDRVRRAGFDEVLAGALESKNENHYYANEMRYPEEGGYFEFVRPLLGELQIKCNKKVIAIDASQKTIRFSDGTKEVYKQLISSIPLPKIIPMIESVPKQVSLKAASLLYTRVDLVSVGFSRKDVPPYLWFYIYDGDIFPARGYSPSMKSPNNAPEGCSSLQFEIYSLSSSQAPDPEELKDNVLAALVKMNICSEDEPLFVHHKRLPFGNVVFDHGMEERRKGVLDFLEDSGIRSCGRFGEWEYFWSDQSFLSGKAAADSLGKV